MGAWMVALRLCYIGRIGLLYSESYVPELRTGAGQMDRMFAVRSVKKP